MRPFDGTTAFQHTAARRRLALPSEDNSTSVLVSTHSRPKAAGPDYDGATWVMIVSTHSRPKAAGIGGMTLKRGLPFQHTAARRRLGPEITHAKAMTAVSTHSRPKAAGSRNLDVTIFVVVSTHSRPKAAGV